MLVTSRAPLRVEGEQEYGIEPLPDADAIELLTQRARAVRRDFEPDEAAREICHRLDGLPLALELAASRLRSLGSAALLERLDRRLPLLTGGRRDAPDRQRTLRATIEWSYDLLPPGLESVFARLAVFAGTFSLVASEAVAAATIDDLDALVEVSLLKAVGEDRFLMLETIREFAGERFATADDAGEVARRHAEHYLQVAEDAGSGDAEGIVDPRLPSVSSTTSARHSAGQSSRPATSQSVFVSRSHWRRTGWLTTRSRGEAGSHR